MLKLKHLGRPYYVNMNEETFKAHKKFAPKATIILRTDKGDFSKIADIKDCYLWDEPEPLTTDKEMTMEDFLTNLSSLKEEIKNQYLNAALKTKWDFLSDFLSVLGLVIVIFGIVFGLTGGFMYLITVILGE